MKFFLSLFLTLLLACSKKEAPSKQEKTFAIPVKVFNVEQRDVSLYFESIGTIKPSQVLEIKAQVSGILTQALVSEGSFVIKGTLLYAIDKKPYLFKAQEMQSLLSQNQIFLKNAQKKFLRYQNLSEKTSFSKMEWDELETSISLLKAKIKGDKAKLALAKLDLSSCQITAPFSGILGKSFFQEGASISEQNILATLTKETPFLVEFGLTEKEFIQLGKQLAEITVHDLESEKTLSQGKIISLSPSLDPISGTFFARAQIHSSDTKSLWGGKSVLVRVFFGKKLNAKLVPKKAVQQGPEGPYVFLVKEDLSTVICPVSLEFEEQEEFLIEADGLQKSSKVVIEGQSKLFSGAKVEEVP